MGLSTEESAGQRQLLRAYGHSWIFGTGARSHECGFAGLAARELGLRLNNEAVSGSLSTEVASFVSSSPPEPAKVFLLMTGLNDARLEGNSPGGFRAYAHALSRFFRTLHDVDPNALVLTISQPYLEDYSQHHPYDKASDPIIDRYNVILAMITARFPSALLITIEGWQPSTMLADDTVHPNDKGHALLARSVVRAVKDHRRTARPSRPKRGDS